MNLPHVNVRNGITAGHLLDVCFQLLHVLANDFLVYNVVFCAYLSMMSRRERHILVHWVVTNHFLAVVDDLLAEVLRQCVGRTPLRIDFIDVVLHVTLYI